MVSQPAKVYQIYSLAQLQVGHTEGSGSDRLDRTYAFILLRYTGLFREEDPGSLNYRICHRSVGCNR